jgi:hypothetical protein
MNGIGYGLAAAGDSAAWIGLALMALAAAWLVRDGFRLIAHLNAAEQLIAAGMAEREALRAAGCLFWQEPWYRRIFRRYPELRA